MVRLRAVLALTLFSFAATPAAQALDLTVVYDLNPGVFAGAGGLGSMIDGSLTITWHNATGPYAAPFASGSADVQLALTGTGSYAFFASFGGSKVNHAVYPKTDGAYVSLLPATGLPIVGTTGLPTTPPIGFKLLTFGWFAGSSFGPASVPRVVQSVSGIVKGFGFITTFTSGPRGYFSHSFVLGSEISRTFIPEPSTAPLAGLGLLVLSGYAARRRIRRNTRRT